jgi:hypothetical protein
MATTYALRIGLSHPSNVASVVSGPPWPQFNMAYFEEFEQLSEGVQSVGFFVDTQAEIMLGAFVLGCEEGLVPFAPSEAVTMAQDLMPGWEPTYKRLSRSRQPSSSRWLSTVSVPTGVGRSPTAGVGEVPTGRHRGPFTSQPPATLRAPRWNVHRQRPEGGSNERTTDDPRPGPPH